ncbi:MAG: SGNH/GDSL hydrolase family protein [Oscillospiraceae bacterium]
MTETRICVFGDSVAKGVVFDVAKQKYGLIKDCFVNLACSALRVIPKNYSKFGCTVTKGAEMINGHSEEIANSDFTILEFGGNDCDYDWAKIAENPSGEFLPKTPLDVFVESYSAIIEKIVKMGGKPVLMNLPPIDAQRFFDWVSRGLNKNNLMQWLGGHVDYTYRWHESYSNEVAGLAVKYSIPMLDIRSAFLAKANYASLLCEDGMHPNAEGHRLISQQIQLIVENYSGYTKSIAAN